MRSLNIDYDRPDAPGIVIGTGGIGGGMFFAIDGNETLGRNESRGGKFLDSKDYCKLHIIAHYIAVLLDAGGAFRVAAQRQTRDDLRGRSMQRNVQIDSVDQKVRGAIIDEADGDIGWVAHEYLEKWRIS